jgi:hypothetical protein
MLGNPETSVHELAEAWNEVLAEAKRLAAFRPIRIRLDEIAGLVVASGAPRWAKRLLSEPFREGIEDPWTPAN